MTGNERDYLETCLCSPRLSYFYKGTLERSCHYDSSISRNIHAKHTIAKFHPLSRIQIERTQTIANWTIPINWRSLAVNEQNFILRLSSSGLVRRNGNWELINEGPMSKAENISNTHACISTVEERERKRKMGIAENTLISS